VVGVGITDMYSFDNRQVKRLKTYLHNKKNISHLHGIVCDKDVNDTPVSLLAPLPQQYENVR